MIQRFKDSRFKIAFLGVVILIFVLGNGCEKKEKTTATINRDSICNQSELLAEKDFKSGIFALKIPRMDEELKPYAEEIFRVQFGKSISIWKNLIRTCGTGQSKSADVMDSCYQLDLTNILKKNLGNNIFDLVNLKADSLHEKDPFRYPSDPLQTATYKGGDSALRISLQKNVQYPAAAKRENIQGVVYVQLHIDSTGKVTNATIAKGVRSDLDSAAISGVMKLGKFDPPLYKGRKVASVLTQPVRFVLK